AFVARVTDQDRYASLTILVGGTRHPETLQLNDSDLMAFIQSDLQRILGAPISILHSEIHRYERAIPLYSSSLEKLWTKAANTWCKQPGRLLLGNYTGQVSLRGILADASK